MKDNMISPRLIFFTAMLVLGSLACNALVPPPPTIVFPSVVPATEAATSAPSISQQVTLVEQLFDETNQTPPFTIHARTPQMTGSDDPRVTAFNQRVNDIFKNEVDTWRKSFQEVTYVSNGSSLEATSTLVSQIADLWSLKFDFNFYSDGAAHPGLYSITMNYDLSQGRELALSDLFLPNSNYLEMISSHCIAELSKMPGFDGPFAEGANPTPENYQDWNITPDGLLITFEMYQVAPGASGPLQVLVPYSQLQDVINPQGPLAGIAQ